MKEKTFTLDQAAKNLGIRRSLLLKTIKCGKIPTRYGRGRTLIVYESDLLPFTDPLGLGTEWASTGPN
jgi:hypothetical protein